MDRLRYLTKALCHGALGWAGTYARARRKLARRLVILTYHSFCLKISGSLNTSQPVALFRRQMAFLKKKYQVVSLTEGWQRLQTGEAAWPPLVAVTIDDGFADNYQLAFPVLKELSIPATVFLATDFIDNGRMPWPTRLGALLSATAHRRMDFPFAMAIARRQEKVVALSRLKKWLAPLPPFERFIRLDELAAHLADHNEQTIAPLSWPRIREMRDAGIAFGSHSQFHSILPQVDAAIRREELRRSKARIEAELSEECALFAYPNGDHDVETSRDVAACGYRLAVTQNWGANSVNSPPLALRRIEIPYHDSFASFAGRVSLGLSPKRSGGAS
jgi:peptidoglycan/xylan/chitin deacetylase (PgdA/CDA1 family)